MKTLLLNSRFLNEIYEILRYIIQKKQCSWPQFWPLYSLLPMPWPWSFSALQKYTNNCIAVRWWLTADTANRIRPWHILAVHLWNKVAGCMDTQTSGCHQGVCWQAPSADKVSVLETKNLFSVKKMGDSSCKKEPGWFRDVHLKWTKTQNRTQRTKKIGQQLSSGKERQRLLIQESGTGESNQGQDW